LLRSYSSLSRERRALGPAIEDEDLSDTEEADIFTNIYKIPQLNPRILISLLAITPHRQWEFGGQDSQE